MILRCLWCNLPCAELEPEMLVIKTKHCGEKHEARLSIVDLLGQQAGGVNDRIVYCNDSAACSLSVARFDDDGLLVIESRHHGSTHQNRLNVDWLYQQSRCLTFMDVATGMDGREIALLEKLLGLGLPRRVEKALRLLVS